MPELDPVPPVSTGGTDGFAKRPYSTPPRFWTNKDESKLGDKREARFYGNRPWKLHDTLSSQYINNDQLQV